MKRDKKSGSRELKKKIGKKFNFFSKSDINVKPFKTVILKHRNLNNISLTKVLNIIVWF